MHMTLLIISSTEGAPIEPGVGRSSRLPMRTSTCTRRTSSARELGRGACDLASTGSSVHRYYDPVTAQFTSVDPLVQSTGQPYAYADGDPVNGADPLGLWGWNPVSDVTQAAGDVGGAVVHHWRGIAQVAIAATAVSVAVVSVGSLSGVSAVLAGAAIGAVSSGASYDIGCVGTNGGCTATGSISATLVGGISGGASAGIGGLVCGDSSLCLSAVGVGIGAGTATGAYYAANALEGTCGPGNGALSAAETGLGGVSASQSDWNMVWNDLKRATTRGFGGGE